ncbi:hypothetical protein [Umezawaea sp. Da 62-37]|uniref:hypothetical protein n=1 Tax=Umezawaea sp. Da 62-37 TaxID=3075927 RepID=UPI0028F715F2|nr:hypothetical protein [Umezawaea sp. Da 62-37]WNV84814.1 hypothetical protein RM788_42730 [Umezawaea sp. Da 62-37]
MNEFASTMHSRVDSARQTVRSALANHDHELAELHEADLRSLERLVRAPGIDVGDKPTIAVPQLAAHCPS